MRAAVAFVLAALAPAAAGQAWPTRPVSLVVPTTTGSAHDVLARIMGPMLAQKLGQPFIVDNRAGASGIPGTAAVAKAAPDGHTLLVTAVVFTMSPPFIKDMPYNPATDLAPVASLSKVAMVLTVHPSVPASTVSQFVSLAKSKPGVINYGSPGNGTPHHLMFELLKQQERVDVVHVPYKGLADMMTGLISGTVGAGFVTLQGAIGQAKAGKLRILSISGDTRSRLAPDIPTFREASIEEMDTEPWHAVFAPAKTPRDLILRINRELVPMMDTPAIGEVLVKLGLEKYTGTPEELGQLVKKELARWQRVVTQAGIKPD
jgi:tripartite-type tricarboxylate transporter receptor subunit TctC